MYKLFKRTHLPGIFQLDMAGASDPGLARSHNEDAITLQEDDGRGYFLAVVCDGMGGYQAGEIASASAVDAIANYIATGYSTKPTDELLREAFQSASKHIDGLVQINPEAKGMGCTAVAVLGDRDQLWIAHVGDSRAYRVRDGNLEALTQDHTMVQEMVDAGLLSIQQANQHPYRGRISRCLGHGKNRDTPTVATQELQKGETLLLCTDGLSEVVPGEEILALASQRDIRTATSRLIEAANKEGGPDNISAVLLRRAI